MSNGLGLTTEETLTAMGGIIELTKAEQSEYLSEGGTFETVLEKTWNYLHEQGNLSEEANTEVIRNAIINEIYE